MERWLIESIPQPARSEGSMGESSPALAPRTWSRLRPRAFAVLLALAGCAAAFAADEPTPSQREIVRQAMRERPGDPWPRGRAHVVFAVPGSQQPEKGYHEPGGSFSPSVRSFGISIWVRGAEGRLKATSDSVPIEAIRQRFSWPSPDALPSIVTVTPHYEATWTRDATGAALSLERRGDPSDRLELWIRSVGPAGGPLENIAWDGKELRIDGRWTVTVDPEPAAVHLGHEGDPGWTACVRQGPPARGAPGGRPASRWQGGDGWGYVCIEPAAGRACKLGVRDSQAPAANPLRCRAVRSSIEMDLPDPRFADCLNAQAAHLLMGLMDLRTPPGEPTNYPLAWQRDGATVVAALARAGCSEVVKQLATYFAENDFFGGFGSEGDAPGQGLRVMGEAAVLARDSAFDRWLWPHVRRKVEFILRMLSTDRPIRLPYVGPIVPEHRGRSDLDLVCEPARDGLIMGRMDFGRPVSYINGISFSGLRAAAALAGRLGQDEESRLWREAAARLQSAWLAKPQWDEQRTYMSGLWPTWVASPDRGQYRANLERRSDPRSYQPWTYFSAAMIHQWLFLEEPERVWKGLEWFWSVQTSPGLYTWWESDKEENTFGLWNDVRGWTSPPHVTPHYWTAGEILALQVDMLAYVDESEAEPVLVIGGGVPRAWIEKPMRVAGVPTKMGTVGWAWTPGRVEISVRGPRPAVRLGASFGPDAGVEVKDR